MLPIPTREFIPSITTFVLGEVPYRYSILPFPTKSKYVEPDDPLGYILNLFVEVSELPPIHKFLLMNTSEDTESDDSVPTLVKLLLIILLPSVVELSAIVPPIRKQLVFMSPVTSSVYEGREFAIPTLFEVTFSMGWVISPFTLKDESTPRVVKELFKTLEPRVDVVRTGYPPIL